MASVTRTEIQTRGQLDQLNSEPHKMKIVWSRSLSFALFHALASYGIYMCFHSTSWKTLLFALAYARMALSIGGCSGLHRLWTHRSYKAKLPLRIFLSIMAAALGQGSIYKWARDHRVHHKFTDTNADPHNIKRGFFYSHMGWLLIKKHPDVVAAGEKIPMDDLLADPVVRFDKKLFFPMWYTFCFIVPTVIPVYFWGEKWLDSFCVSGMLRYVFQLHCGFTVNSVAHYFGYRPVDKTIEARHSHLVSYLAPGEGTHNFHHTFPRDYTLKEHSWSLNSCRFFIEFMAFIGQAYDLKTTAKEVIEARKLKTGDGRDRIMITNTHQY